MLRNRLFAVLQGRQYGTAVAATQASVPAVTPQGLQVQRSPGGLTVASEDNLEPVSRLVAVVKAGARYEQPHQKGFAHALRRVASLSSTGSSQFMLEKRIQQMGANLSVTGTREHVIYTVEVLRDKVRAAGELLGSVVTGPVFKSWEMGLPATMLSIDREMAAMDPFMRAVELLHSAAYRNRGLGNSLFSTEELQLSGEQLEEYIRSTYAPERMSLYGQGVGEEDMADVAGTFVPLPGGAPDVASPFKGGEIRHEEVTSPLAIAIIAAEGVSVNSPEMCTYGVLEQVLGCGPSIKWSTGQSRLNTTVAKATDNQVTASCFNASYSDSGLFGVQLVGEPGSMAEATNATFAALASVSSSGGALEQALSAAKCRLKAAVSFAAENSKEAGLARAVSLVGGDSQPAPTLEQVCKDIDGVTAQAVQQAAKKMLTGKLAMSAVGNISSTPYLDEIKR